MHILTRAKLLATTEDMTKVKNLISNNDLTESRTRERSYRKWNFCQLTKVTIFAALLEGIPVGCKALCCQILYRKIIPSSVQHTKKTLESRTMKNYVSVEVWHCICRETRDSTGKIPS